MTRVLIPTVLRPHCDGQKQVEVAGTTVAETIRHLTEKYPDLREAILTEDSQLRNHVNVFVNDENIRDRDDEQTSVSERDEIVIVPALAGG